MSRRPDEQAVIDRFVDYLIRESGDVWEPSKDEISTLKNNRKYDCEFNCSGEVPIAADVCGLFPLGSHQGEWGNRARFTERVRRELKAQGLGGLMIRLPPIQKKHANPMWVKAAATKIQKALQEHPLGTIEVEDFTIERIADDAEQLYFYNCSQSCYQPIEAAGVALATLLRDKHDQLDVEGHQRFLIIVNTGCRALRTDVAAACAFINFGQYPNFDQIYFEESPGCFYLVYVKEAWVAMEAGELPRSLSTTALVTSWIEERLSGNWPGALNSALQISWERHNADWLSEGGRELLDLEASLFLQNCEWKTPRDFWQLLRGAIPQIGDGRRKAQPIGPR